MNVIYYKNNMQTLFVWISKVLVFTCLLTAPALAKTPSSRDTNQLNLLKDRQLLIKAKEELQQLPALTGQPILVYRKIDFFDGVRPRIELAIQKPNTNNELIFYTFANGQWTWAEYQHENEALSANLLMDLEKVDFVKVVELAQQWQEKAQSLEAVLSEPYYIAWVCMSKKCFWHTATIESIGKQYYLSFQSDGSIWEFKQLNE